MHLLAQATSASVKSSLKKKHTEFYREFKDKKEASLIFHYVFCNAVNFCKQNHRSTGDGNTHRLSLGFYFVLSRLGSEIRDSMVIVGLFYYHSSVTHTTQTWK